MWQRLGKGHDWTRVAQPSRVNRVWLLGRSEHGLAQGLTRKEGKVWQMRGLHG